MKRESTGIPAGLLKAHESPCISIYMPTGRRHPENLQDALHFKNLVNEARQNGVALVGKRGIQPLLDRLIPMIDDHDFWMHTLEGLAVFVSPDYYQVLPLQEPVAEQVSVTGTGKFHVKPLLRLFQGGDRFQVLAVTRTDLRLYEGNRFRLDEIRPAAAVPKNLVDALGFETTPPHQTIASFGVPGSGGTMRHGYSARRDEEELDSERFYRIVDREIEEWHSKPTGLPLILAALPEHQAEFRSVSRNPHLLDEGLAIDPRLVGSDELRQLAWELLEPRWEMRLDELRAKYEEYYSKRLGDDDPYVIAKAARAGRVSTLLLDSDRRYPGSLDPATGRIVPGKDGDKCVGDVLEDLAMLVLDNGGEVLVLPSGKMPSQTGVAALYRYA
ncbi:MAG: hypothetical protein HGB02_09995 [Chlorobiaceae bacterium]|nr:hypothetical protein [Chlorobiaceae bacterium]